jgi:hypothetical protein
MFPLPLFRPLLQLLKTLLVPDRHTSTLHKFWRLKVENLFVGLADSFLLVICIFENTLNLVSSYLKIRPRQNIFAYSSALEFKVQQTIRITAQTHFWNLYRRTTTQNIIRVELGIMVFKWAAAMIVLRNSSAGSTTYPVKGNTRFIGQAIHLEIVFQPRKNCTGIGSSGVGLTRFHFKESLVRGNYAPDSVDRGSRNVLKRRIKVILVRTCRF